MQELQVHQGLHTKSSKINERDLHSPDVEMR